MNNKRRIFISWVMASICSTGLLLNSCSKRTGPPEKPNVVIIVTDDQGTLDTHTFGSDDLYTPNMDRLAETGIMFTQAYAHTVCCPARAALLTGRSPQRCNVNTWTQGNAHDEEPGVNMYLDEVTIAEILKERGYRTGLFGKWHVGADLGHGPLEQGFDEFYGLRNGFIDNYNHYFLHDMGYHDLWDNKTEVFEQGKYFPDLTTEKAVQFIEKNAGTPFLLYLGFNIPHYPEQYDPKFDEMYQDLEEPRRNYARMVSTTDDRIGFILYKLEELDLRDNTIIFFISDNGHSEENGSIKFDNHNSGLPKGHYYGANGGGGNTGKWRGHKGTFYEGGVRVPAIVSYPGVFPEGVKRDQIVTIMDFLPTICDVLKIDYPDRKLDGYSMMPIIDSEQAESGHQVLYFQWFSKWAVREGDWKLIAESDYKSGEKPTKPFLGNLSDEKPEVKDYSIEHPEIVERLTQLHDQWAAEVFEHHPAATD